MIDLRSDTVTRPTAEMREAMANAEVGDDVYGEDPSVIELEEHAAQLAGKEAALFVTSGTQGNQAAVLTHMRQGEELIMDDRAHLFLYEGGATAAFAGVQSRTLSSEKGQILPADIAGAIRPNDVHFPDTGLIWLENTHNKSGGSVLSADYLKEVKALADRYGIPVHIDGARIFNASIAAGVPVEEFARHATTIQFCLSKGLGAPVGSILAGDRAFIERARKWRKRLGGGLRQAGVIAAPALLALKNGFDFISQDHEHASILAEAISNMEGLTVMNEVETNMIMMDTFETGLSSEDWVSELKKQNILAVSFGPFTVRLTTHRDISRTDISRATDGIMKALHQLKG
ncbi:low-specificity L-threonine aldolase [Alteribacter natronophilus]|uniref:low-specificity L-threonine aldolase n=1 Tax=Alteribacter natronophilus TaxID=2583810 RepID=UPI00110F5232|nr:low-specificity L-threonine aldolase [Alteribacter natronophilus]TMW71797.1 low-specificity L-threonine aldolase [Alteribacter natronophilus]